MKHIFCLALKNNKHEFVSLLIGRILLNRQEATSLLKEVYQVCGGLGEQAVMLMPPDADDVLSQGFQLHIKAPLGNEHLECVKPLVQKHKLAMTYEPTKELLVIYRPLK
jgi:hypothetical protein